MKLIPLPNSTITTDQSYIIRYTEKRNREPSIARYLQGLFVYVCLVVYV